MASPLDQVTFDQSPGYMPIKMRLGDDLVLRIDFPFDVSLYTFSGGIFDALGNQQVAFTIVNNTTYISASVPNAQTETIESPASYSIKWTSGTGLERTFISGPMEFV